MFADLAAEFPSNAQYGDKFTLGDTGLAACLVGVGRFHEADPFYQRALQSRKELSTLTRFETRNDYADLLMRTGRFREAQHMLQQAFQIAREEYAPKTSPGNSGWGVNIYRLSNCHLSLGRLYLYTRRFADAEDHLLQAIDPYATWSRNFPSVKWAHYHLGKCYHDLAEVFTATEQWAEGEAARRESLAAWEAAGDAYPAAFRRGKALAYYRLGELLHHTGRTDEAARQFASTITLTERLAERQPECPVSNWQLICLLANCSDKALRDPPRAVQLARQVTSPSDGPSWRHLALAHYRSGEWSAAREAIERSMDLRQGGDAVDKLLLAMAFWQLDELEEARNKYAEAQVEIAAGQPIFYEYLGVLACERLQKEADDLFGSVTDKPGKE